MTRRPRILHAHSTFDLGGKEARSVALINAFGGAFEHDIVSADRQALGAARLIDPGISHRLMPPEVPPLEGWPSLKRWRALAAAIARYDLLLTYNWGSMDAVMANRLFARIPHVHHEDGFNQDEVVGQKPKRVLFRRLALARTRRLVVPSRNLARIARTVWHQPEQRIAYVPNGIDMALFDLPPAPDAITGFARRPGELVVGTLAGLRPVKNLPRLVRAFAAAAEGKSARLVIVGSGPEDAAIRAEAAALGIADRVHLPGFLPHPSRYVGLFDIFALSSDSEQFPISLVEAMAAGLPAVSTDVGDVREILAEPNRALLAAPIDEPALARHLATLLDSPTLRTTLGTANKTRVAASFSHTNMVETYRALYEAALGQHS